jgi:hypothetical protein
MLLLLVAAIAFNTPMALTLLSVDLESGEFWEAGPEMWDRVAAAMQMSDHEVQGAVGGGWVGGRGLNV